MGGLLLVGAWASRFWVSSLGLRNTLVGGTRHSRFGTFCLPLRGRRRVVHARLDRTPVQGMPHTRMINKPLPGKPRAHMAVLTWRADGMVSSEIEAAAPHTRMINKPLPGKPRAHMAVLTWR